MNDSRWTRMLCVFFVAVSSVLTLQACASETACFVEKPDTSKTNNFYVGNRPPLVPGVFIKLPVGSVKPDGWLRENLQRQSKGLTGRLDSVSARLQKEDNAWLSKDGKGKWGWEELPYWLKGYANIGYILDKNP